MNEVIAKMRDVNLTPTKPKVVLRKPSAVHAAKNKQNLIVKTVQIVVRKPVPPQIKGQRPVIRSTVISNDKTQELHINFIIPYPSFSPETHLNGVNFNFY